MPFKITILDLQYPEVTIQWLWKNYKCVICSILKCAFLTASTENIVIYLEVNNDRRKDFPLKAILIKGFYILLFWSQLPPKITVWLAKSFFFGFFLLLWFIKDFLQNQYMSLSNPFYFLRHCHHCKSSLIKGTFLSPSDFLEIKDLLSNKWKIWKILKDTSSWNL